MRQTKCLQYLREKAKISAMQSLSLRQQVAQMVMPRLDGARLEDARYLDQLKTLTA
jgi:uncharacterized protein YerC